MSKYTKEDIIRLVKEHDVKFIRLQFTDILGTLKNIAITSRQLEKALDNKVMFDGSSIEGFVRIEESDMYLYPDLDTFTLYPWRPQVARLICDVYKDNGQPFEGDPRYVLKRALAEAKAMGYDFNAGPECEFFLFLQDEDGNPTTQTNDKGSYFDLAPIDKGENARRDICLTLEDMGFEIEASHHEVAPGQHEIDFKYGDGLHTADNVMTFELVVKTIAKEHALHGTFMPKPKQGICGSGMHINMSLFKGSQNSFVDETDKNGLSREAYAFIAGLIAHCDAITAVCNPLVNSYKRLVPGYEAPCYVAWSAKNRSPLVRVPSARGLGTRVELRSPDPSANPYLALAVCLAAGLDGIKRGLTPPQEVVGNIYEMDRNERKQHHIASLPKDLGEAIKALEADEYIKDVLGAHVTEKFLEAKKAEWKEYNMAVSQWEIDRYLTSI